MSTHWGIFENDRGIRHIVHYIIPEKNESEKIKVDRCSCKPRAKYCPVKSWGVILYSVSREETPDDLLINPNSSVNDSYCFWMNIILKKINNDLNKCPHCM